MPSLAASPAGSALAGEQWAQAAACLAGLSYYSFRATCLAPLCSLRQIENLATRHVLPVTLLLPAGSERQFRPSLGVALAVHPAVLWGTPAVELGSDLLQSPDDGGRP